MSSGVWDLLKRLLGGRPEPPRPAPRPSRAAPAAPAEPPAFQHLGSDTQAPTMTWHREKAFRGTRVTDWARRTSTRQRLLVALAALSLAVTAVVLIAGAMEDRRLPRAVAGLWRPDAPAYAGRLFELRSRRIAFLTGDSTAPVTVFAIRRVRTSEDAQGILYRVTYRSDGADAEFAFVYDPGPPEHIRFANQRQLVWRRFVSNRSLLPDPMQD